MVHLLLDLSHNLAAGSNGHEEATALLLYRGANFNLLNSSGISARADAKGQAQTPYTILETHGYEELCKRYPVLKKLNVPAQSPKSIKIGSLILSSTLDPLDSR